MKFKLVESIENKYKDWLPEDIELYESIDWDSVDGDEYDAGFAYLDSAYKDSEDSQESTKTEFHKFFNRDANIAPCYKAIDLELLGKLDENSEESGKIHKGYKVYNHFE